MTAAPAASSSEGSSTLSYVSASQITLYRECMRKWAWKYLARISTPQNASAALGTEVDEGQLQPFLRENRPLNFTRPSGEIAASLLAYLPKPQTPGMQVQKEFRMPSPTWIDGKHIGFGYHGFEDLWLPDSKDVPGMPGGAPFVGDFKTTGDIYAPWTKNEKTLATDVQAILYATDAMFATGARKVDLAWMYAQTKGPRKSRRVHLRVVADQVATEFGKINETAVEMLGVRKANPAPTELPPNPEMCRAYGGCPYESRCNLSPAQIIAANEARASAAARARMEEALMSNVSNGQGGGGLLARLKAQKAAAQGSAPAPTPPTIDESQKLPDWMTSAVDPRTVGVNPPENKLPPAQPVGVTPTPAPAAAAAPATAKRGPGRPKKTQPDPLGADAHAHTQPTEAAPSSAPVTNIVNEGPRVRFDVDVEKAVTFARAIRAAAEAFLNEMGAAS